MSQSNTDPFEILGIEPSFEVDRAAIERGYLRRVASVHPDVVNDQEADDASSRLNDARRTLIDPESRANALLRRLGGPGPGEMRDLPASFLAEMMQTRLEIEEAAASGDHAEVARWQAWAARRREKHIASVRAAFATVGNPLDREALRAIRLELNTWRYIERLIEQLPSIDAAGTE
ncbi:MAG: DnaJ domain-containing protein [Phycisphaerales bacterium]